MAKTKLLWIDLETTGLDPNRDVVLEVAMVLTDHNLHPQAKYHAVVRRTSTAIDQLRVGPAVAVMHNKNGLWDAVFGQDSVTPIKVAAEMDEWARRHGCYKYPHGRGKTIIAGASVHFDRRFLETFAPRFHQHMHHQHFDVSAFRNAFGMWYSGPQHWPHNSEHRAMDDVADSIEQARFVQGVLRG